VTDRSAYAAPQRGRAPAAAPPRAGTPDAAPRLGGALDAAPRLGGALDAAPPVVLIHGVGFGPGTLAALAGVLTLSLAGRSRVIIAARRGYGERSHLPPARTVAEHVDDVLAVVDRAGAEQAVLVGVSGGATVALAAALCRPERVVVAVSHEPAVGSFSPELRAMIDRTLSAGGGRELVRLLAGASTWASLASEEAAAIDRDGGLVEADALAFLEFEPELPLAGARVPLVCSVGERSPPLRFEIAQRLAERTGAPLVVVPGSGHLAQLDAPIAFAEVIIDHALAVTPAGDSDKEHPK
jgi:pimeloyl-ACP methyl ester carboxylesterase